MFEDFERLLNGILDNLSGIRQLLEKSTSKESSTEELPEAEEPASTAGPSRETMLAWLDAHGIAVPPRTKTTKVTKLYNQALADTPSDKPVEPTAPAEMDAPVPDMTLDEFKAMIEDSPYCRGGLSAEVAAGITKGFHELLEPYGVTRGRDLPADKRREVAEAAVKMFRQVWMDVAGRLPDGVE